jgi:sporulation protein YlmC with PRC-barrel domain
MRLSWFQNLQGLLVIDAAGQALGEVDEIFFDDSTWHIDAVRVKLRKDVAEALGAKRSMFRAATIEVPTRLVRGLSDTIVLAVRRDELRSLVSLRGAPATPPTPAPQP